MKEIAYVNLSDFEQIKDFLFGGNSTITLKSIETGKHFTFKVKQADMKDKNSLFFVSVLSGSDNYSNYSYIGIIKNKSEFRLTQKSKVGSDAISFKAFNYFFNQIKTGKINNKLEVLHSGKCARCNRKLTTPESIKSGFGPICYKLNLEKNKR